MKYFSNATRTTVGFGVLRGAGAGAEHAVTATRAAAARRRALFGKNGAKFFQCLGLQT